MAKKKAQWLPGDLFIPGLAMLLGAYYLYTIRGLAPLAQLYGGSLSIFCIVLFLAAVYKVLRQKNFSGTGTAGKLKTLAAAHAKFIVLAVFTTLFIVIIPTIGYPASSILFVSSTAIYLRYGSMLQTIKVSVIVTLIGFVLFILFLNVGLPLDVISERIKEAF